MTHTAALDARAYAAMIEDHLKEVTADLRTIDLVDLVSFIRFGSFTAIEDLVHSSVELFFRQGSLISAWTACVEMAWDSLPAVTLGLEFRHPLVCVFFDLLLQGRSETVTVHGVLFEAAVSEGVDRAELLAQALIDARLPRRAAGRPAPAAPPRLPLPRDGGLLPR